jgi:Zn ribbon nucleic-acid-binding protein
VRAPRRAGADDPGIIPAAVLARERADRLPIPAACPHCGAAATAFRDDGAGSVSCLLCGWALLYRRPAGGAATAGRGRPGFSRGRGRAAS